MEAEEPRGEPSHGVFRLITEGTGRFNLTQGAIGTAVGIGASLSQTVAGSIVLHLGYNAGVLFLAGIASAAFGILFFLMPERAGPSRRTRERADRSQRFRYLMSRASLPFSL